MAPPPGGVRRGGWKAPWAGHQGRKTRSLAASGAAGGSLGGDGAREGELEGTGGEKVAGRAARLQLAARVTRWPKLGELWLVAAARGRSRLAAAMGQLTCTVLVAFGRGLLESIEQGPRYRAEAPGPAGRRAAELLDECRDLLHCGLEGLRTTWLWTDREVGELRRQLEGLRGGSEERRPWPSGQGIARTRRDGRRRGGLSGSGVNGASSSWRWRAGGAGRLQCGTLADLGLGGSAPTKGVSFLVVRQNLKHVRRGLSQVRGAGSSVTASHI